MSRHSRIRDARHRRLAARAARTGAVLSAAMLVLSAWAAAGPGITEAAAAPVAGVARIGYPEVNNPDDLAGGGSDTDFAVRLPTGAACTGDSASDEYRVQSYMVPASVDPATLTFGNNGPLPAGVGADFRQPLVDTVAGKPYANALTDIKVGPDQGGNISGIPAFDFHVYGEAEGVTGPELVPEGTYNLGIACTLGPPSPTQIDKYWNVQIAVTHDPADEPAGFTWTVVEDPAVATTVTLTVTPPDGADEGEAVTMTAEVAPADAVGTVTFRAGADDIGDPAAVSGGSAQLTTTDLEPGEHDLTAVFTPEDPSAFLPSTSNTVTYAVVAADDDAVDDDANDDDANDDDANDDDANDDDDSIAPPVDPPVDTGFPGGPPSGTGVIGGQLPRTGGSALSMIVWGALLVVFGRMAVLLGRPARVIPAGA